MTRNPITLGCSYQTTAPYLDRSDRRCASSKNNLRKVSSRESRATFRHQDTVSEPLGDQRCGETADAGPTRNAVMDQFNPLRSLRHFRGFILMRCYRP